MPRAARFVCPGVPHHVTQRGNRRGRVFFADADYLTYLAWLHQDARRFGMGVVAYCLMTNHVHMILVPDERNSLRRGLQHLHMRFAQRANRLHHWTGHVWQGRFFSAPLDERYFWSAIRYVERNPVRAGMVECAEHYPWSSARAHCTSTWDPVLTENLPATRLQLGIGDWSAWLAGGDDADDLAVLREHTVRGLPCGSETFVEMLQQAAGRNLKKRCRGRPRGEQKQWSVPFL